eukprot:TRINITY_DN12251_c0_g1_i2.p1 TRINITY_DN12251_c0_g1~~TRINITY_DN12251_c0_g1_i2.p1  ORF type:complete len:491 (+),score=64.79 TRINITY_DN12251_c0_g1_i2:112-1584(+)
MMEALWLFLCLALAVANHCDYVGCQEEAVHVSLLQVQTNHTAQQTRQMQASTADKGAPQAYYWANRGRDARRSSWAPYRAPTNFSSGPSWIWPNDLKEQVRHSPLIDADMNIYVCTTKRLRKFTTSGNLLWTWNAEPGQMMSASPVLYNGSIYVLPHESHIPTAVSIDMASGTVNWKRHYANLSHSGDAESLSIYNDRLLFGALTNFKKGTDTVVAARVSDGHYLWDFVTDTVLWNFMPSFPGDSTVLFSSTCGTVFRLSLEGELLWRVGAGHDSMCVPAGGAVGPNGLFYAEYRETSEDGAASYVAAHNISDGSVVWKSKLPYRAAQYPAVGQLGPGGPLAVVAAIGDNPLLPAFPETEALLLKRNGGAWRNAVIALDAATGATLWHSQDRPWNSTVGAGDYDKHDEGEGPCFPDAQGIPVIAGDGSVYTSSSQHGDLRAIRDADADGIISPWEVSTFETKQCFLNSPSMAPGMLVAALCWGPMYVFKD